MLRSVKELTGYVLHAEDGEIGRCKDFLFDDEHWTIRYMVADTGKWLPGRKVLVSPISLGEPDWQARLLPVRLTKKQIEDSPDLDEDAPVSRQYEINWNQYYAWPSYWAGPGIWGPGAYPTTLYAQEREEAGGGEAEEQPEETHVRSVNEVTGYHVAALDGEIGHIDDFIVDEALWVLRFAVIDTRNLLPGKKVLLATRWISSVDWYDRRVIMDLTVDAIKNGPTYDPSTPVNREYEERLYDYYGRPKYWV